MPLERTKITKALESKGFRKKEGDHEFYCLYYNERKSSIFTKISRGSGYKEYSDELVAKVCKQMALTKKDFFDFVECSLTYDAYIQKLLATGKIK